MLLQATDSLPKIKTKKYYKFYENKEKYFEVFYNKDIAILDKNNITIFSYENTIVMSNKSHLINKVLRDFVLVYRIKPHNINKEHTIQHKIDSIVGSIKSLIKENEKKYDSFAYTQKPFTVCFVQLYTIDDYSCDPLIIYYEFSHDAMRWIKTDIKKLDLSWDDCSGIIDGRVLLNRYYELTGFVDAEDDEYIEYNEYDYVDKFELLKYYFIFIYDLFTGKEVYRAETYKMKDDQSPAYILTLDKRTIMFVGTSFHIIPIDQYNKFISYMSISDLALKFDSQETPYTFEIYDKGMILYIFRNLQFSQIFFIYNNCIILYDKSGSSPTSDFDFKYSNFYLSESTIEHIFLRAENFFTILLKVKNENILKSLCMYYDLEKDLYKYDLLDITKLVDNIEAIRNATIIGRIVSENNNRDCRGIIISTELNQVVAILYDKVTSKFIAKYATTYQKISDLLEYKIVREMASYVINKEKFYKKQLKIEFYAQKGNIFSIHHISPVLNNNHVVFNSKHEEKISVVYNNSPDINNSVREAVTPNIYHNLASSIRECYFECLEPTIVYSCKNE